MRIPQTAITALIICQKGITLRQSYLKRRKSGRRVSIFKA